MALKCLHCKAAIGRPLVMHDQHGAYMRCPFCLKPMRLREIPRPEPRARPHMSKKDRLRQRRQGKETELSEGKKGGAKG